jgi:hypothetical protein
MAPPAWLSFTFMLTVWSMCRSARSDNSLHDTRSIEACAEIAASVSSASMVYHKGECSPFMLYASVHSNTLQVLSTIKKTLVTGRYLVRRLLGVRLNQGRP